MRYLILWIRWVFGAHTLFSGLNYFFNFFPTPAIDLSPAGPFVAAMTQVGLYDLIKVVEVVVGAALLLNWYVPLALLVEFPITVSIFQLDVIIDHTQRPLIIGTRELVFNLFLMASYAGYYRALLTRCAPLSELWRATALPRSSRP
ncbi:MAG TPA: hypothetical protein VMC02_01140 [Steroidobacteraceae bacterium]|nr:hypothetical protein [Steroidobacteraceae bacterium]HUO37011.1 hypothetical protein [Mycobacterium sp.]